MEEEKEYDIQERWTTDLHCIWIFLAFNAFLVYVVIHFTNMGGSLTRLTYGYTLIDGNINFCGLDNSAEGGKDMTAYPYLYYYYSGINYDQTDGLTYGVDELDFTKNVCVKKCPAYAGNATTGDSTTIEWYDNIDKIAKSHDWVLDFNTVKDYDTSNQYMNSNLTEIENKLKTTINGEPRLLFSNSVAAGTNYCVLYVNSDIPDVKAMLASINEMIDSFIKSTFSGSAGTGTVSQVFSSISGTVDCIMLGFLGSSLAGILVLLLFSNSLFVGVITYVMVLSISAILGFGTYMVQNLYLKQIRVMQGKGCFINYNIDSAAQFWDQIGNDWQDGTPWVQFFGWPGVKGAGESCTEDLKIIQLLCVVRWVVIGAFFIYTIFIIINFKSINDAINCIRLASMVLAENIILIVQPIYNMLLKLLVILFFMVIIGVSLSSSAVSPSLIDMYVPDPLDNGAMVTKQISGVARQFDMMYNMGIGSDDPARRFDVYFLWTEVFMMYWWLALIIAFEQFTTVMTVCVWFFTQKQGEDLPNAPSMIFCTVIQMVFQYHFGSVLFGSFLIAIIWTAITMIIVYKEALKATMSHEALEEVRDYLISCAIWLLNQLKDCVEFGNKLAYINISMNNNLCFPCAACSGLMEVLSQFGKSLMIMMVNKFFVFLGYVMIMSGGGATCFLILNFSTSTPILGLPTSVPQPLAPVIFTAAVSYFMGSLFMDIFELSSLTFMFVREKNDREFQSKFGPDAKDVKALESEIDKQDLSGYMPSKKDAALLAKMNTAVNTAVLEKLKAKGETDGVTYEVDNNV